MGQRGAVYGDLRVGDSRKCGTRGHPLTRARALDQASANEIVIHREGTESLHVKLDSNTKIERNGAAANITDLAKGEQVTVTYRLDASSNQPVAESVHIVQ